MNKRDNGFFYMGLGISSLITVWMLYLWYVTYKIDDPFTYSLIVSATAIVLIGVGIYNVRK